VQYRIYKPHLPETYTTGFHTFDRPRQGVIIP